LAISWVESGHLREAVDVMTDAMCIIDGQLADYICSLGETLAEEGDELQVRKFINGFQ
jgi:hypothetical protein